MALFEPCEICDFCSSINLRFVNFSTYQAARCREADRSHVVEAAGHLREAGAEVHLLEAAGVTLEVAEAASPTEEGVTRGGASPTEVAPNT